MSELINNSQFRKDKLKELILKIHDGASQESVRKELEETLSEIPYGEVVEVEQELIDNGLPEEEVLKLCDVHSAVLHGNVDLSASKDIPEGHPVDVLLKENKEIKKLTDQINELFDKINADDKTDINDIILKLRGAFNNLYDVDKHYKRKELLIFPYLEKQNITGPPKVMWGKHDEIREQIKGSIEILKIDDVEIDELKASIDMILYPAIKNVRDMTIKEEEILFPMALDKLAESEWIEVSQQSLEIGFCLYDPPVEWRPKWIPLDSVKDKKVTGDHIQLHSGGFSTEELTAILNTLPIDMTFVDKNDKVKYFSQGDERVFQRSRAILNRDVRHCHPPASAHIVDKIVEDFKSGKESRAPFWINLHGKFIHIEYFALRNEEGEYLGTLEVSHDVKRYRELEGERRILSYEE